MKKIFNLIFKTFFFTASVILIIGSSALTICSEKTISEAKNTIKIDEKREESYGRNLENFNKMNHKKLDKDFKEFKETIEKLKKERIVLIKQSNGNTFVIFYDGKTKVLNDNEELYFGYSSDNEKTQQKIKDKSEKIIKYKYLKSKRESFLPRLAFLHFFSPKNKKKVTK